MNHNQKICWYCFANMYSSLRVQSSLVLNLELWQHPFFSWNSSWLVDYIISEWPPFLPYFSYCNRIANNHSLQTQRRDCRNGSLFQFGLEIPARIFSRIFTRAILTKEVERCTLVLSAKITRWIQQLLLFQDPIHDFLRVNRRMLGLDTKPSDYSLLSGPARNQNAIEVVDGICRAWKKL